MKDLSVSSILLTTIRGLGIFLQALVVVFLTRILTIDDMGRYAMVYAVLGLVRYLGAMGTDQVVLRRISLQNEQTSPDHLQDLCNSSFIFAFLNGVVISLIAAIYLFGFTPDIFSSFETILICLSVPAFSLVGVFAAQIRGMGYNLFAQIPEAIVLHLVFGGLTFLALVSGNVSRSYVFLYLCLASWFVVLLYLVIRAKIGINRFYVPSWSILKNLAKEGFAIFQAMFFTVLSLRVPIFLAGIISGPAATAIIEIAYRFGYVPSIITTSVSSTFAPHFARIAQQNDRIRFIRYLWTGSMLALVPAFFWMLFLVVAGKSGLEYFLPAAYSEAYQPLLLITLAASLNAAFGLASTWFLMSSNAGVVRWFSLAQFMVICMGGIILGQYFGVVGIACAVICGSVIRDGGMFAAAILFSNKSNDKL